MPEKPKPSAKKGQDRSAPKATKAVKPADAPSQADASAKLEAAAKKLGMKLLNWEPERLANFIGGNLTIAQLENISKEKLYDMASVAYRLMTQGRLEDAEKIFAGLSVMDPYDAYFQLVLGSIAQRKGIPEVAEKHYTRSLEIDQNNPATYANRGEVRLLLKKFPEAISDFSEAVSRDKEGADPASMRARVMLVAISNKVQDVKSKLEQVTAKAG